MACRLIALDKCPGVKPIGVGEVLRRIVSEAILSPLCEKTCREQWAPYSCVWDMKSAVRLTATDVQGSRARDSTPCQCKQYFYNRSTALCNVMSICTSLVTITINAYRQHPQLFIQNQKLLSRERTTQGDPLAIPSAYSH